MVNQNVGRLAGEGVLCFWTTPDKQGRWSDNIDQSLNFYDVLDGLSSLGGHKQGLLKFFPRFRFYIHTSFHKNRIDIFEPCDSNKINVLCFKNLRRHCLKLVVENRG